MKIKRIDHFVITTDHLDDCLKFYQALGLIAKEAKGRHELFGAGFKINVHTRGNELHPHARNISPGSVDICFEINADLEAIKAELSDNGINLELDTSTRHGFSGEMSSIYLRDPDGNLVELCSYDR
jgi:catechol 2,3-dioxygenase-like lactoylglutathione lyase family enzyme